ncbi:anti-sigma factor family protein [Nodularia sp. NIES-3585]|uniref:anti-sigma factor family protein n=1 Tax=Nodularia sp. NIES-3585 TaxID=1973477 RepID=UPI000B5CAFD8|nr:transcriptional regulator [Nodularia sp. NIES-3585]GAX34301.1 putative transcriptional regulator [Nodularia sp. NIES-3585]
MNTNSPFNDLSPWLDPQDLSNRTGQRTNESTGAMDMVKRDRFELLSAYLDGEVTAAESRQVEEWLKNDASVQCLYSRLLNLRRGLRTVPVPTAQQPPELTAEQVLKRVRHRSRPIWAFGGAVVAACIIGAVSGLLPGGEFNIPQLARQQPVEPRLPGTTPVGSSSPLMVALNNPVIEIPKAAIASPEQSVNLEQPLSGEIEPNIN